MGEKTTSHEEAEEMKRALHCVIDNLHHDGFTRSQISAVMAGIGIGIIAGNDGSDEAMRVLIGIEQAISETAITPCL